MRFNSNNRQRTSEIDRRVEQVAKQLASQVVTDSRRSNTVGLKIPFLAYEALLEFDTPFQDYRWRAVAGWSYGSVIDVAIDPYKTVPGFSLRVYGVGVWLICAAVDVPIAVRLTDNVPVRDRVRIETRIDDSPTLRSLFRIRSIDVWESLAINAQQNLGETWATHRAWFILGRNEFTPYPTPTNYESFDIRSAMQWERVSFSLGKTLSRGREPLRNASVAIWKIDSLISTAVAYAAGNQ